MTLPNTESMRASPPERYAAMSAHFLQEAEERLAQGDLQQAAEKIWGAAAQAVKAYAQRQGWNHHAHNHLLAAVTYLSLAFNRSDLASWYDSANFMHHNFYEHQLDEDVIRIRLGHVRQLVALLAELGHAELPQSQPHLTPEQRERQERRRLLLTRKTAYSLGPEYTPEEAASLPSVNPQS